MQRREYNTMEDEFGFNDISETEYNKLRAKEQKKSMPQPQKKRKRNPFMIGSDARPWKGLFGLKKWLIK